MRQLVRVYAPFRTLAWGPWVRPCARAAQRGSSVLCWRSLAWWRAISRPSAPSWLLRSAALFASAWSTLLRTWPVLTSACQLLSQTPPDRVRSELRNTPLRGHVGSASAVAPCRPAPPVPTLALPPCPWPLATKPCCVTWCRRCSRLGLPRNAPPVHCVGGTDGGCKGRYGCNAALRGRGGQRSSCGAHLGSR